MCSAVLYCFTLTIVTGVYYGDNYRFTRQSPDEVECYACKTEDVPVSCFDTGAVNVAQEFQVCLTWGFYIHLAGIFADASFAARIYVKKTQWFRTFALIFVTLYSLMWLGWLISLFIIRYRHVG